MENIVICKECLGCQKVQAVVVSNEQMIQQQIKLIKNLHNENQALRNRNQQLQSMNSSLKEQLNQTLRNNANIIDRGQQTDKCSLESSPSEVGLGEDGLKVSTRVNIKAPEGNRKQCIQSLNKENLQQMVPIFMIRKDEQFFARKRKNSFQQQHNANYWLKIIEPKGSKLSAAKLKEKTLHLVKKMIPHEIRHIVWPAVTPNCLVLTEQFYFELLERKNLGWVSKEVKNQIQKDIVRSFNVRDSLQKKEGLKLQVTQVLEMFHLYRPDISYVQGMTYPIIVLTLVVGKVKAFQMFANLILGNCFFRKMYLFEPHFIQAVAKAFQLLLYDYQYDIADKLNKQNIDPQLFLVEWFYTIFSRSLSFEGTLKLWDQLLYHGEVVLFRMSLAIFELVKPHIMEANYQDTVGLTQGFASYVREDKLIDIVVNHSLTGEKVQKLIDKTEKRIIAQSHL